EARSKTTLTCPKVFFLALERSASTIHLRAVPVRPAHRHSRACATNQDRTVIEPRTRTKYLYDGMGLRVAKKSGAAIDCTGGTIVKLYWRSISGDTIAETDSTGSVTNGAYNEYVFFSGRRIASRNGVGAIFYYFADHLGTTRTITTG